MFAILRRAVLGVGLAAAGAILSAGLATAATTTTPSPHGTTPGTGASIVSGHTTWCVTQWWISGNGVRIHAGPHLLSRVRGLGYRGTEVPVFATRAGWSEINDGASGHNVLGWISDRYLVSTEWCS